MRKNLLLIGAGIAALSALTTLQAKTHVIDYRTTGEKTIEAIVAEKRKTENKTIKIDPYNGGLDFPPVYFPDLIMSPMEYGLSIYHGNKRKRSNRLRFSHNAKLKRRNK